MGELDVLVRKGIAEGQSKPELKARLSAQGFMDVDIDVTIQKHDQRPDVQQKANVITTKEIIDRIGYGLTSPQLVNILFLFTGAGLFLIGLVNGLKAILTNIIGGLVQEYDKSKRITPTMIRSGGILFGFSFIFLSIGIIFKAPWFFTIALLSGSIGIVTHGDTFQQFTHQQLRKEKMPWFLAHISLAGLLFTAAGLLVSGYIMSSIPLQGIPLTLSLLGMQLSFRLYGFIICFEVTAILFIISGYLLSRLKPEEVQEKNVFIFDAFLLKTQQNLKIWRKNSLAVLATAATVLIIVSELVVNSYFGIFIYRQFSNVGLGGFMNVAVIFVIALVAAVFGPLITRSVNLKIGEGPMLVFGTLLVAILPLTIYASPMLISVGTATAISIIGAALLGTAQGMFFRKILLKDELAGYFSSLALLSIIPIIILVPIFSWMAQSYGIGTVMLLLALLISCVAAPLYFIIVWKTRKIVVTDFYVDTKGRLTLDLVQKQVIRAP
ncbi:MAG: hypothetical protein V1725_01245 [archaeon]